MGLGDLCKYANQIFNGESTSVRVFIRADVEHKCFQFQLELVQTFYDQVQSLIGLESVKNAKEILEWIGIITRGSVFALGGLFGLYKKIFGDRMEKSSPSDVQTIEARSEGDVIIYQIVGGDGAQITVPAPVHQLAQDPRMLSAARRVLGPLSKEGYTKLEFEVDGQVTQYFSRAEATAILESPENAIVIRGERELISKIRTSVRVRKAIFEGGAKWNVMYKKGIEVRIADQQWLEDYQAGRIPLAPKWKLIVDLEERVPVDEDGVQVGDPTYTILKVHGVEPPPEQSVLFRRPGGER